MSSTIKTVAIAGASGSLGAPITQALVDAGFTVTALTRPASKSTFPSGVKAVPVDYTSNTSLQAVLDGQDALISTLAQAGLSHQAALFEAAVAAGVKRILPGEFGSDSSNPKARALPVYKDKVEVEELVHRLCEDSGGKTTYTLVLNNAFLDWGVETGFLIDTKNKKYEFIDGGNGHFTITPLDFVAAGVVAILQRPEATANKTIRLQGARLTQRKFLEIVQRATGSSPEEWTVTGADSKVIEKEAFEAFKRDPANFPAWGFGMLKLAIHVDGFGGDFGANNDNEMLGLKELSEGGVEEVVRKAI